jgi:predicted dehydrogenase
VLRVAVVGVGQWGPNLVRCLEATPACQVVHVVDHDAARLAPYAHLGPTTDLDVALGQADALVIATPGSTHAALARRALEAGLHVLVEKPLAQTVEQALALEALAAQRQRVLMVGHVFLFNPAVRAVKALIDAGELGTLRLVTMVRANLGPVRRDVDAAFDLMSHDLSIADYWLGSTPHTVSAVGVQVRGAGLADSVVATARYPGEVTVQLHASWVHPRKVRDITVTGTRQLVSFDDLDRDAPVRVHEVSLEDAVPTSSSTHAPHVTPGEPLLAEVRHFVECVLRGRAPLASAARATSVVRTLCAIERSMAAGGASVPVH